MPPSARALRETPGLPMFDIHSFAIHSVITWLQPGPRPGDFGTPANRAPWLGGGL